MEDKNHIGWALATGALAIALGLALGVTFSVRTATSWLAFPRFLLSVLFLFVLPGTEIIRWCRLQVSPIEHLTLSVVLGIVATCCIYAGLAWLNIAPLLYFWIVAALPGSVRTGLAVIRRFRKKLSAVRRSHFLLLVALAVSWLPMYVFPFYYDNLSRTGHGGLTYSPDVPDVLLHTSVAAELTHALPPQTPFVAREPLSYHAGMDLVAAVLHRYGGVDIPDLVVRFCPTLFVTIDVLAVFCLARRFVGSEMAAVASTLLVMLGEDFSFIPGLLQSSQKIWSVQFFAAPTVFSLYFANPMVLALGLLFSSLFCLDRSLSDHRWGWIIAATLCSTALVETKIFIFAQLFLALLIVLAFNLAMFRRWNSLKTVLVIALTSLPLILYTSMINRDGADIVWMRSSGLESYVKAAFEASNWQTLILYPPVGLIVYLALTYGFRVIGVGKLIKCFRPSEMDSLSLLLACFVVLGPVLTLTTKVVPSGSPDTYNNSIWFMVASKYVTTLFAILALTRLWHWLDWKGRSLLLPVLLVVSFASTIQYMSKLSSFGLNELRPSLVETIDFLNHEARPGQIVVSRLNDPILGLTKLRIPVYVHFAELVANRDVVVSRRQEIESFWQAWIAGIVRADLLEKYRVDWIVASRQDTPLGFVDRLPIGPVNLKIEKSFMNEEFIVYRVRGAQQ